MVFHCSLSDSKSFQFFRTLLSILTNLKNAVVWMASFFNYYFLMKTCDFTEIQVTTSFISPSNVSMQCCIIIFSLLKSFSYQHKLMRFAVTQTPVKIPQNSKSLLIIPANLNNTVVWMVSSCPLISKPSTSSINHFVTYWVHQLQLVSLSFHVP